MLDVQRMNGYGFLLQRMLVFRMHLDCMKLGVRIDVAGEREIVSPAGANVKNDIELGMLRVVEKAADVMTAVVQRPVDHIAEWIVLAHEGCVFS